MWVGEVQWEVQGNGVLDGAQQGVALNTNECLKRKGFQI